ncbi:MAG: hypothetical protein OXF93_20025 [Acidobacteria bacterium]|nr:hypothetical protein [Acidobacteriota bacterium]
MASAASTSSPIPTVHFESSLIVYLRAAVTPSGYNANADTNADR